MASYFEAFTTGELRGKIVHYGATIEALKDKSNRARLISSGQFKSLGEIDGKLREFESDLREIEEIISRRDLVAAHHRAMAKVLKEATRKS